MNDTKHLLSCVRRAVDDYSMIADGDKIAVGVSGGKDSLTLLCAMAGLARFYPKKFELMALTVDMGFQNADFSQIEALCKTLGVEYKIVPTQIAQIIFEERKETNPCSLCAKMRRGVIHSSAKDCGCNKVALGHHFDDVVETFMLNLYFEGRIGCFSPVTYLSRTDITLIRPLIYLPEKDIRYYSNKEALPIITSPCPADGNTQREEMKKMLSELDRRYKGLRYRIFGAIQRGGIDGFCESGRLRGIGAYDDSDLDNTGI